MRVRSHIRSSAISYLALFLALGGVSYAAATIGSRDVIDDSLLGRDVKVHTFGSRTLLRRASQSGSALSGLGD